MTSKAEQHLTKAKDYVAKGEAFYRKAADEIVAAQEADPTLGYREIGDWFGFSYEWARKIVQWRTSVKGTSELPFSEPQGAVAQRHTRSVLRSASPEQVAEILDDPAIRQNVAKAQQIVARQSEPPRYPDLEARGPAFIDLVVRINSGLIELESLVKGWENPSAIPAEFSAASFDDISEKAMRIKDTVNALRSADNDEFQEIVRNFRLVAG